MIKFVLMVLVGIVFNNRCLLFAMNPQENMQDFDMQDHGAQVQQMLYYHGEELFAHPEFKIMDMLLKKSITPQLPDSHNSLTMKVLKSTHNSSSPVRSFVAYETFESNAFIRLLVTHHEAQRNGYAQLLIHMVMKSLIEHGVSHITFETRKQNARAIAFYDKLLRDRNDVSYLKTNTKSDGTDVIRYDVTFKNN